MIACFHSIQHALTLGRHATAAMLASQPEREAGHDAAAAISPVAVHTFPFGTTLRQLERAPDGDDVVALMDVQAINFWSALAWWWPEIVITLVLAATLLIIWRLWHRQMATGEWRCKECQYALAGLRSKRCPECGTLLTDRTRVRARFRRKTWRIALLAALLGAFALLYVNRFPGTRRTGEFSSWMHWNSVAAFKNALNVNNNLMRHAEAMATVARIDPATGDVLQIILQEPESAMELLVDDDSKSFLLRRQTRLGNYDMATGRLRRSIDLSETDSFAHWADVITFAVRAGRRLNAAHILTSNQLLLEWNLENGQLQQIGEAPKGISWRGAQTDLTLQQRRTISLQGSDPGFIVVGGEGLQRIVTPVAHSISNNFIAIHPTQPIAYFTYFSEGQVHRFQFDDTEPSQPISDPPVPVSVLAMSRDGAWLFARAGGGNDVLLFDTARQRWRARLTPPLGGARLTTGIILADNKTAVFVLSGPAGQAMAVYKIPD